MPLLALERAIAARVPVSQDEMMKAINAAMTLVEETEHFWAGNQPHPIKEIAYTKAKEGARDRGRF